MKIDEYRIEHLPNGEWGAVYGPDQRVRLYDDLATLMKAMGAGLPKDHPRALMVRVEIYDGADWPPYEGKP
jgi:hypothetical protein